jgi:enamine deaminase RidA (YjgF/YER057c/UK114 family)
MRTLRILLLSLLVAGYLFAQSTQKKFVPSPVQNPAISGAVSAGGYVYTSGMLADANGDITAQTKQVFDKLRRALQEAGSSIDSVAVVNVMLKNASDISAFDQVYRSQFKGDLPARTMYLSRNMARPGALVEIQMTGIANGGSRKAITPPGWMKPDGPYSYAIQSGDTLYLSAIEPRNYKDFAAQVPDLKTWPSVQGDVAMQVKLAMDNATEVLKAGGMTLRDAVSSRVAVRDGSESLNQPMDEMYRSISTPNGATRMRYRGGLLGPYEFQVTLIAIKGSSPREVLIAPNADGSPGRTDPKGRFADAIKVGNRLYLSGVTSQNPSNVGNMPAQVTEILTKRLGPLLKMAGFDFKDVVHTEVELTDMPKMAGVDEAFRKLFPTNPPARHVWGVNALSGRDTLVDIGLIAVK